MPDPDAPCECGHVFDEHADNGRGACQAVYPTDTRYAGGKRVRCSCPSFEEDPGAGCL